MDSDRDPSTFVECRGNTAEHQECLTSLGKSGCTSTLGGPFLGSPTKLHVRSRRAGTKAAVGEQAETTQRQYLTATIAKKNAKKVGKEENEAEILIEQYQQNWVPEDYQSSRSHSQSRRIGCYCLSSPANPEWRQEEVSQAWRWLSQGGCCSLGSCF